MNQANSKKMAYNILNPFFHLVAPFRGYLLPEETQTDTESIQVSQGLLQVLQVPFFHRKIEIKTVQLFELRMGVCVCVCPVQLTGNVSKTLTNVM